MASTIPREPYSRADIERIKADIEEEVDTFRLLATIDRMQEDLNARIERPDTTTNDVDLDALRKVAEAAEKEREATTGIGDVAAWKFIHAFDPPTVLALLDELRDGRAEVERLRTAGDAMAEAVDEQGHYLSDGLSRRCADCDKPSPITTNAWDDHYSDCPVLTRRATLEAWCKATGVSA